MEAPFDPADGPVVITGATGMLGQAMVAAWSDYNHIGLSHRQLDISNLDAVTSLFSSLAPSVVINCAAYTNVDRCETEEYQASLVNHIGPKALALGCRYVGATFMHFGTDYVFDGSQAAGYAEDSKLCPINAYGRTKAAGEQFLGIYNPRSYLIRTSWLYGPGGKNFVDTILHLAHSKLSIAVVNDQHGCPTFTRDLACYTRTLLEGGYPYGVYHGVNSGVTTWHGLAVEAVRLARLNIPVEPCTSAEFPRPARRPTWSVLLNLRGPAMRPWQSALSEYLATSLVAAS